MGPTGATGPGAGATGPTGPTGPTASLDPDPVTPVVFPTSSPCSTSVTGVYCWWYDGQWRPYSELHAAFPGVGFFKDKSGFVHLQGIAYPSPSALTGGPVPAVIFYLPAGDRPTDGTRRFSIADCRASPAANYVDIGIDGSVTPTPLGAAFSPANCIPLDGISFHP